MVLGRAACNMAAHLLRQPMLEAWYLSIGSSATTLATEIILSQDCDMANRVDRKRIESSCDLFCTNGSDGLLVATLARYFCSSAE